MGYQKWREEFIALFAKHVPQGRHSDALAFLRDSSAEQRWNEVYSSIDIGERETERQEKKSERRVERVRARAAALGLELDANGDPRGEPFTLLVGPTKMSLTVPGRGLPARCFQ